MKDSQDDECLNLQAAADINALSSSETSILVLLTLGVTSEDDLAGAAWIRGCTVAPSSFRGFERVRGGDAVGSGGISTLPKLHTKAARHHMTSSAASSMECGA
jgi:hypothetical protein